MNAFVHHSAASTHTHTHTSGGDDDDDMVMLMTAVVQEQADTRRATSGEGRGERNKTHNATDISRGKKKWFQREVSFIDVRDTVGW